MSTILPLKVNLSIGNAFDATVRDGYPVSVTAQVFNPGVMHVNALTNAQKLFSQMLILRYFQEVNTQANTQQIHTYKPKTFFATIANAQFSIHTANHI